MWRYTHTDELMHYGVPGMRWGHRKSNVHDDHSKAHSKKKIKDMSNDELRSRNNRLQLERQYKDLTKKSSVGKKVVQSFIKGAGTIAAVSAAYATYKKFGNKAIGAIGDYVVKGVNLKGPLV